MKRMILCLGLLLAAPAFAAPRVEGVEMTLEQGVQLTLVSDTPALETVVLEVRNSPTDSWRTAGRWQWSPSFRVNSLVELKAAASERVLEAEQCRVLFFGPEGLMRSETFNFETESTLVHNIG
jgi:hypothetical protein